MRILVLGGLGKQGKVVVENLIRQSPLYQVSVVDSSPLPSLPPSGVNHIVDVNLHDYKSIVDVMGNNDYDMAVCTLPSKFGFNCVKASLEVGLHMVDLSYTSEDLSVFNEEAKDKGLTVIVDAGIAPGLSNLVTGRAQLRHPNNIDVMVGGIPQNHLEPFGYTITWSLDDLIEEYVRPARIRVKGKTKIVPALSGLENVCIVHDGKAITLEAFYTDGLRSILNNHGNVPNISEKTMRYCGHINSIKSILDRGKDYLKYELKSRCEENAPDILVMKISADHESVTMITESNKGMSAMARTTALSCATFASLVASKTFNTPGVFPPEKLASDDKIYKCVLDRMARFGVLFSDRYPFM
jgi:saccharopine dehydrogenase-like NADP-dependent oxidoreductase